METTAEQKVETFFNELKGGGQSRQLFEHIPDILFFVKDAKSRLITCNQAMLKFFGRRHVSEIYGRTGADFFPESIASPYLADDRWVLENNKSLIDNIELALRGDGELSWFCSTKLPLLNKKSQVVGLMGITRWLDKADQRLHPAAQIMDAVTHIQLHYSDEVTVPELADLCHLSVSQFHRLFKRHFRQTPLQFLLKLRIQEACRLLRTSSMSMFEITDNCGFSDQNYFARHFRQVTSQSPSQFRKKYKN
jgi:AraC-like DNA-binding protein